MKQNELYLLGFLFFLGGCTIDTSHSNFAEEAGDKLIPEYGTRAISVDLGGLDYGTFFSVSTATLLATNLIIRSAQ